MQIQATIAHAGRLTATIVLLAVLSASLWTVHGAVLCVAPDGSLAIEAAGPDGACLSPPPQPARDAARFAEDCPHGASECAGCTDLGLNRLPAGIHNLADSRRLRAAPHTDVVADAIEVTPDRAANPAGAASPPTRLPAPETPIHLASTVLQR